MNKNFLLILVVALSGAILGSLVVSGLFSSSTNPSAQLNDHEQTDGASHLPVDVKNVFLDRERAFDALGPNYFRIDEGFVDDTNGCDFCIAVEYKGGPQAKATFGFKNSTPVDLSEATILTFAARGQNSGEKARIFAAGLEDDSANVTDSGIRNVKFLIDKQFSLTRDWTVYEVQLQGLDLKKITHAFAFQIIGSGSNERQVIYIDAIFYGNQHSDYATVLN